MNTQEDFEKSKARLEDLSERHHRAVLYADALKVQYDDAQAKANKLQEQLTAENARYVELEQKLESEQAVDVILPPAEDTGP